MASQFEVEHKDRFLGCLFGLAIGDAVGTSGEFKPSSFEPKVTDMVGGGPHRLRVGDFTDDTSMALCLGQSLLRRRRMDLRHQLLMYRKWKTEGYMSSNGRVFDIGNTIRSALGRFSASGCQKSICGVEDRKKSGNGSLMRLAPVPMLYCARPFAQVVEACGRSSLTTHASVLCVQCCEYYGGLIWGALHGVPKSELLTDSEKGWVPEGVDPDFWVNRNLDPEVMEVIQGSYKRRNPCVGQLPRIEDGGFRDYIVNAGFVVKSFEAALWTFAQFDDYRVGVLDITNRGHDADTVGAIYGMLAGASVGYNAIPVGWRQKIRKRKVIGKMALDLLKMAAPKTEEESTESDGETEDSLDS